VTSGIEFGLSKVLSFRIPHREPWKASFTRPGKALLPYPWRIV